MSQPLPNFVIAGAQKCGTTSLAAWLHGHPDVFMAMGEVHFFDRHWDRGLDWYRSRFTGVDGQAAVGEKTPSYIAFPEAVERMAATLPEARLIVSLRDPVERFYSQWRHMHTKLWLDRRSIEEVVTAELRRSDAAPRLRAGEHAGHYYLARGRFIDQLRRLFEHYPAERVLVTLAEDLEHRPVETFARVCRFLGVTDAQSSPRIDERWNPNEEFRPEWLHGALRRTGLWERTPARVKLRMLRRTPYAPLAPDLRARLAEYYAEPNAELGRLLGRDLSHWGRD